MQEYRDTDYGNYSSFEDNSHWSDDFWPQNEACRKASAKYDEFKREVLDEIAFENGLSTEDWDDEDYEVLIDKMGIVL